jgi:hypothetical protein
MSKKGREDLVRSIWYDPGSIPAVARNLGVTKQAINNVAERLGLPKGPSIIRMWIGAQVGSLRIP